MIIRNGIRTTLRAKGRTVLFFILIFMLTVTTILGLGMWAYCSRLLEKCDETYTSIALLEYLGAEYNNADAADDYARAAADRVSAMDIGGMAGVDLWEMHEGSLVAAEGYTRRQGVMPLEHYAVLEVTRLIPMTCSVTDQTTMEKREVHSYSAYVERCLYAAKDVEGKLIMIDPGDIDFNPEKNENYLVNVWRTQHGGGNAVFALAKFPDSENPPYLRCEGAGESSVRAFEAYANRYESGNNYLRMEVSEDISSLEAFHQGTVYLTEGRFPKPGETGVCVLSGMTAQIMGAAPGDTITVDELISSPEDRMNFAPAQNSKTLTVVGITNALSEYDGYLWASADVGEFTSPMYGFVIGRAVLDNKKAEGVIRELERMVPDQVRVTLLDQGYSAAARPIHTMLLAAQAITVASICGVLVVLFLFAYLFVHRQKENVDILFSLGTPVGKIRLWILSGVTVILVASVVLGAALGGSIFEQMVVSVIGAVTQLYAADQRYSETMVGAHIATDYTVEAPIWPAFAAAAGVFVIALLLCLLFLGKLLQGNRKKKGKIRVRIPGGTTSVAGKGAARFAWLSAKRGGWRSLVVLCAALAMTVFTGLLAGNSAHQQVLLEALYSSGIEGNVVGLTGRSYSNLILRPSDIRILVNSGKISDLQISTQWQYWMPGEKPDFGETMSSNAQLAYWLNRQPSIVAVNDIKAAPEFYYVNEPEIAWLDGYDASIFSDDSYTSFVHQYAPMAGSRVWDIYPVIVSQRFLETQGLALGDETLVSVNAFWDPTGDFLEIPVQLKIVGVFSPKSSRDYIYTPLSFGCPPEWFTQEKDVMSGQGSMPDAKLWNDEMLEMYLKQSTIINTCRFQIKSAGDLDEFRAYLEENGISAVGEPNRNRMTVVLKDQSFTETAGGIQRYLTFTGILFPVMLAMVGLMGFVISWLMVNGRRMEFAIMRSMGAKSGRVFFSFFLEQGGLCLAGCILGVILLLILGQGWIVGLCAVGFFLCYLLGCALSILLVGRTNLVALLSERE